MPEVMVEPQLLMYVGVIAAIIQVLKTAVPAIQKVAYLLPFVSIAMGVGTGFAFMPGDTTAKVTAGLMCGLGASGLFKAIQKLTPAPPVEEEE